MRIGRIGFLVSIRTSPGSIEDEWERLLDEQGGPFHAQLPWYLHNLPRRFQQQLVSLIRFNGGLGKRQFEGRPSVPGWPLIHVVRA